MARAPTDTCGNEDTVNPATDIGWLLTTSYNRLLAEADKQLAPIGLTGSQYGVLLLLAKGDASTSSELCQLMDYDRGAMTRLLQRLEAKGILTRMPDLSDRRAQTLALTSKGNALHEQVQPTIDRLHAKALHGLDQHQAKALATLLCRVIQNLS